MYLYSLRYNEVDTREDRHTDTKSYIYTHTHTYTYTQKPRPLTVGLALEEQMVESVPLDTFDLPLDFIVTPSRVYTRTDTHT